MNAARQSRRRPFGRAVALWPLVCLSFSAAAAEWPQFRGPTQDGISTDRLNKQWTGAVTNPIWRVALTNCLGSVAVSGGRVFTQTIRNYGGRDQEVCVALNAATGAELWAVPVDNTGYDGGVGYDDGPRSTPAVDGDSVYVLTSYLKLYRLNATNGALIWQMDLVDIFNGVVIPWQSAASPVLESGLILLNCNSSTSTTLMALRTADGSVAWRSQNDGTTHATPSLATIHGVRQVIFATANGLTSLDASSGELLWRIGYPFNYNTSLGASPVVFDDMVFVTGAHAYGMGSMLVRASFSGGTWQATQLWATNNPASHWMTPVARDGFLYGHFGIQQFDIGPAAQFKCVDMRTGAVKWSVNNFGHGGTILVDDHLVAVTETGQLVLIKPSTNSYTELARFTAIPGYHDFTNKCWNMPAVSDGRVFVRSSAFLAAFDMSVPGLKVDPPRFATPGFLDLSIRTTNGMPVTSNRLTGLEVRASTNLSLVLTQWDRLTNFVLSNGVARLTNVSTGTRTQQFFIVSEPK